MIDTEALRKQVLELAVKGSLVEQLAEEGNAAELIEANRRKKEELVEVGILRKEKIQQDINEEDVPFAIPDNWKWVRLGDYCQKVTDQVASGSFASLRENVKSYKEPNYAVMVKTADFSNDFAENLTYTDKRGYDFLSNSNLFGGELILSNIGSIGKCFIVPELNTHMTLAPNAVMIRLVEDSQRDYLYYFLLSNQGYKELMDISTGIAMIKFNKTDLKTILVPIPPIREQMRINAKVKEIFNVLDKIDKLQEQLGADRNVLREKIVDAAIQGRLTEQLPEDGTAEDLLKQIEKEKQQLIKEKKIKAMKSLPEITEDEIPFNIPNNWKFVRLGEVLNEIIVPQRDKPKVFDGDIPWCRIEDAEGIYLRRSLSNQNVSQATVDEMNLRVCPKGTILSACSGASIGRILITERELCTNQTFNGLVCSSGLYNKYLFYYMNHMIDKLRKMGTGAAMAYISQDKTARMVIPFPPYNEQVRIVEKIDRIMDMI